MNNYALRTNQEDGAKGESIFTTLRKLLPLLAQEGPLLAAALFAVLINSALTILVPILVGDAVDKYIVTHQYHGVLVYCGWLLLTFFGMLGSGYAQTRIMGAVGQRVLFRLRGSLFNKLQELPIAFFNQNKAGDLISRINNDTDKLNQLFSRSLVQFVGNIFIIIGAGIAMVSVNSRLGGAALIPAAGLIVIIALTTGWVKRTNFKSLQTLGGLSAEIQESLENFRVIIAFNRRDYFRNRFAEVNEGNYKAALVAGVANNTYVPVFGLASNAGTLIVVAYGLSLISTGAFSYGLLVSYLSYVNRFYDPLRQMASIWSDLQTALAGWDRISEILGMKSDLAVLPAGKKADEKLAVEFRKVGFSYPGGKQVLSKVSFEMARGKTYALVGPTGGGKTTTASLIARLFDPTEGQVWITGHDARTLTPEERAKKVGFILQDPFLFSGTVGENILYGNSEIAGLSTKELAELIKKEKLEKLVARFDQGLDTPVSSTGEGISLGQKQLIAFMRAVLRHPQVLILDEATANVDTVTEQLLEEILTLLPKETTIVIIAHRLNTIENADGIFFVNGGSVTLAGSMADAVKMLSSGARKS